MQKVSSVSSVYGVYNNKNIKTYKNKNILYEIKNDIFQKSSNISFGKVEYATFEDNKYMYERADKGLNKSVIEKILKLPSEQIKPFYRKKSDESYVVPNIILNDLDEKGMKIVRNKGNSRHGKEEIKYVLENGNVGYISAKEINGEYNVQFCEEDKKGNILNRKFFNNVVEKPKQVSVSSYPKQKQSLLSKIGDIVENITDYMYKSYEADPFKEHMGPPETW